MVSTGFTVLAGEISSKGVVDYQKIVRDVIRDVGYDGSDEGFDYKSSAVLVGLGKQSQDIAMGVDAKEQGAGDQGIMFGYANNETPELMPATIALSHKLLVELAQARKRKDVDFLRPDSKSQVTIEYKEGKAARIDTIVLSTQHTENATQAQIKDYIIDDLVKKYIPEKWIDKDTKFHINPTGRFVIGGPHGDAGLTDAKLSSILTVVMELMAEVRFLAKILPKWIVQPPTPHAM